MVTELYSLTYEETNTFIDIIKHYDNIKDNDTYLYQLAERFETEANAITDDVTREEFFFTVESILNDKCIEFSNIIKNAFLNRD